MTLPLDSKDAALAGSSKRTVDARTPVSNTPSRIATPPSQSERGRLEARHSLDSSKERRTHQRRTETSRSTLFDTEAVDNALLREVHRQQRESTPGASPSRKRQRVNGDRFVPPLLGTFV